MKLVPKKKNILQGAKLAGGNPENSRVENDYYATNPKALNMLLDVHPIKGSCLEPCVGGGHLANVIKNRVDKDCVCVDLVDRGYPNTIVQDFLVWKSPKKFDCIITNPPYSLGEEFIRKSLSLLKDKGVCAMFLKIQFLEGDKRQSFFKEFPPKYIYVFSKRIDIWNNGNSVDPKTGKKWANTMCFAWFIWEKNSTSEPIVRWL